MTKTFLQFHDASPQSVDPARLAGFVSGALLMSIAVLVAWMPAVSARPIVRVQSNGYYGTPRQVINFPPVVPFNNSIYSPSGVYPSGYGYGQPRVIQRRSINNSVLINPTVINSPIRNSTLINPTIVTTPSGGYYSTPYYPSPYFNTQTITTTTRPEPEVYIDPQYGVRYRSPAASSQQQIIIYPGQITYPGQIVP